ncbi:IS630 transposase-related protein [Stenoxybacter acetivorans]|uniref:IS630 transposase-related protein n=1 Tax=Stenoxybacter acetivorans TaxID=422441 RepID=UPI000559CAB9|nr:IS630 transposase-related protein [Stenoxybacter acetivorans]
MTYPAHFRQLALDKIAAGGKVKQIAAELRVSVSIIYFWKSEASSKEYKPFFRKIDPELLRQDVEQYPDDYQAERAARFGCTQGAMGKALDRLKLSRKRTLEKP